MITDNHGPRVETETPEVLSLSTCLAAFSTLSLLLVAGWTLCASGMAVL